MPTGPFITVTLASGIRANILVREIGLIVSRRQGCVVWSPDFRTRYRLQNSPEYVSRLVDTARGVTPQ